MLALTLAAAALVTAGPAPASHAAEKQRPAPNQPVFPRGYRGIAVHGESAPAQSRPGAVVGVPKDAKRLPALSTHATATDTHTITVEVLDRNGKAPQTAD